MLFVSLEVIELVESSVYDDSYLSLGLTKEQLDLLSRHFYSRSESLRMGIRCIPTLWPLHRRTSQTRQGLDRL